jgi:hypothetical protein
MNNRIVSLSLMLTFLLFALATAASAQTRVAGVSVGNKFKYSLSVSWGSNDPNATPSQDIIDQNNTEWAQLEVTAVSGTNITAQMTAHYKNGTGDATRGGSIDVNTGVGQNFTGFVISANLGVGDSLYNSSTFNAMIINDTMSRSYASGARATNHINVTMPIGGGVNQTVNDYWDKSTGVLVEGLIETVNQTATYTTTSLVHIQITSSDVWTVPEFPTWAPVLLILIVITSGTMIIAKQRRTKDPSTNS